MNRVLTGLLAVFVVVSPTLAASPAVAGSPAWGTAWQGPDRATVGGSFAELIRPIPVAMPIARGTGIDTAGPASVVLVRDRGRHYGHRHRRSRRHYRDRAALSPAAWLG